MENTKIESVYQNSYSSQKDPNNKVKSWYETLTNATWEKRGEYDLRELNRGANDWGICACGNLCDAIPREDGTGFGMRGQPLDEKLSSLGYQFSRELGDMLVESEATYELARQTALKTHKEIEERATQILVEMGLMDIRE